jgi:CRP/FNR family transcriptional regulator, cyclic AMP receptor protein
MGFCLVRGNIPMKKKTSFEILENTDLPGRTFAAGEEIITIGTPSNEMYVVRKGRIGIKVNGQTVAEVEPGGIFGEMGLIDHEVRSAGAVALEASEVVPIDERLFVVLVQDTPYFALDVMRTLVERVRAMNARI